MSTSQTIGGEIDSILRSNLSELFYQNIGSTWFTDTLYLFVLTPLNVISFIFNAFCCFCFAKNGKKLASMSLYRCLLGYAANNCVSAFIIIFLFCSTALHYIPFVLSIFSRIYRCFMFNYVISTFYFVGKEMEILILCERLGTFHPRLKRRLASMNFSRMRTILPIIYVIGATLNVPFYLRRTVKSDDHLLLDLANFNKTKSFLYCDESPLISTRAGWMVLLLSILIRDFITLGVEIALSVWLVVSFRRFLSSKLSAHNIPVESLRMPTQKTAPHNSNSFRFATFRKTTRTVILFAIASISFNMSTSILYLLATSVNNSAIVIIVSAIIICMLIVKPFLTFYVFYKLDKNMVGFFRCFCFHKE